VDGRSEPTQIQFTSELGRLARRPPQLSSTTDGRWALVSTSLTAVIAGSIAWLAVGTMARELAAVRDGRNFLPYRLFQQLTQSNADRVCGVG